MNFSALGNFLVQAIITAFLTYALGHWLTLYWNVRQKRREAALITEERFWKQYGKFFVIWKMSDYSFEEDPKKKSDTKMKLFERIMDAESDMEGILLKLI